MRQDNEQSLERGSAANQGKASLESGLDLSDKPTIRKWVRGLPIPATEAGRTGRQRLARDIANFCEAANGLSQVGRVLFAYRDGIPG